MFVSFGSRIFNLSLIGYIYAMEVMKFEKIAYKMLTVVVLSVTFYYGVLEGPFVSESDDQGYVLFTGMMLGFFLLFLGMAVKIFKS